MHEESPLTQIFEEALVEKPEFTPADLPSEWTVGQHRYVRVEDSVGPDGYTSLSKQLDTFREQGVRVLDYGRRWGSWIFKTMAPSELAS